MSANEECLSDEIGIASDGIIIHSYIFIGLSFVVVVSGAVLWYFHRFSSWLYRRNAGITFIYVIPVICNVSIGALYRIFLNTDILLLSSCQFGNFFLSSVIFTLLIPNLVRIILFVNRVELNKKLVQYDAHKDQFNTQSMIDSLGETGRGASALVNERSSVFFTRFSVRPSKKIRHHQLFHRYKYKASSRFGRHLSIIIFISFLTLSTIFTLSTCPIKIFSSDNCQYGFSLLGILFYITPTFMLFITFIYFKRKAINAPDPFGLRKEIQQFLYFIPVGVFIVLLDGFNAFNLKSDDSLGFKFVILGDYLVLMVYIHAIHYQVYLSRKDKIVEQGKVPIKLKEVLDHPQGSQIFKRYLQMQFTVELFIVYKLVEQWKRDCLSPPVNMMEMDRRAENIFNNWIDRSCDKIVVEISTSLYEQLSQGMERIGPNDHYAPELFDDLENELFQLMNIDSFPRFTMTDEYKVFSGLQDPVTVSMKSLKSEQERKKTEYLITQANLSSSGLLAEIEPRY